MPDFSKFAVPWLLAFMLVLVSACASFEAGEAPSTPIAVVEDLPLIPAGVYEIKLSKEDYISSRLEVLEQYQGHWELKVDRTNHYEVNVGGTVLIQGGYELSANTIRFNNRATTSSCSDFDQGDDGVGVYSWVFKAGKLTLFEQLEPCMVRKLVLESHPLVLVKTLD